MSADYRNNGRQTKIDSVRARSPHRIKMLSPFYVVQRSQSRSRRAQEVEEVASSIRARSRASLGLRLPCATARTNAAWLFRARMFCHANPSLHRATLAMKACVHPGRNAHRADWRRPARLAGRRPLSRGTHSRLLPVRWGVPPDRRLSCPPGRPRERDRPAPRFWDRRYRLPASRRYNPSALVRRTRHPACPRAGCGRAPRRAASSRFGSSLMWPARRATLRRAFFSAM